MADDLVFEYTPSVANDNLRFTTRKRYTKITDTLAVSTRGGVTRAMYVHGNSNVILRRGTADVSKHYAVRRFWRVWSAPLDPGPPESRTGSYSIDFSLQVDSAEKPLGEWKDAPGFDFSRRQTRNERVLFEWIISAETPYRQPVQGLGGLYFIVLLDLTPTLYKFSMSRGFPLTEDQLESSLGPGTAPFLPADAPWKTEADMQGSNDWPARHIGWETYATYNNQLPVPVTPP